MSPIAAGLMVLPVLQTGSLQPSFKAQMNQGGSAAIEVRVVISPAGEPVRCDEAFVNGPQTNIDAFCSMLESSTRFAPARDAHGLPTYGVIHVWSQWQKGKWIGSQVPQWNPPELAVTTNRMPHGFAEDSLIQLVLNTDSDGKVGACLGPAHLPPQALNVFCRAAAQTVAPIVDEHGTPVAGVQEFRVRVMSQPALDKTMKRLRSL